MKSFTHLIPAAGLGVLCIFPLPACAERDQAMTLTPGNAIRLDMSPSEEKEAGFFSSDPGVVQVFANGFCFGIAPGQAQVKLRQADGKVLNNWTVEVTATPPKHDILTIRQFPDNRRFIGSDGRVCYGCELNCRQDRSSGTVSNRVVNPASPESPLLWPVEKDAPMVDGTGALIGTLAPQSVGGRRAYASKFNHGMTKVINGEVHVYSFATPVRLRAGGHTGETTGVSAGLPLRLVLQKEALLERLHPGTGRLLHLPLPARQWSLSTWRACKPAGAGKWCAGQA